MSTVYTLNGKVLKNASNDKWLAKKEAPAGFVMNASNAIYNTSGSAVIVSWQGPAYPSGYNGNGKQYILVNNNTDAAQSPLLYSTSADNTNAPQATNNLNTLGTSTGVLQNNPAGGSYGAYLVWPSPIGLNKTVEEVQAYMANVTITILDP